MRLNCNSAAVRLKPGTTDVPARYAEEPSIGAAVLAEKRLHGVFKPLRRRVPREDQLRRLLIPLSTKLRIVILSLARSNGQFLDFLCVPCSLASPAVIVPPRTSEEAADANRQPQQSLYSKLRAPHR